MRVRIDQIRAGQRRAIERVSQTRGGRPIMEALADADGAIARLERRADVDIQVGTVE